MDKPAPAAHPIHELISSRWSPRAFADRPVEGEKLLSLFEAARWAPSSFNGQPWHFLLATRDAPAEFERMLGCLVEFNQTWARAAPVLVIAVARLRFEHNNQANGHALHDVGLALSNLALQATSMGLCVHMMAGFDAPMTREVYKVPVDFEPITAAAIGYPGDPGALPPDLKKRELSPRQRKPVESFVFAGEFGRAAFQS